MVEGEPQRQQAIVLGRTCCPLQQVGGGASHIHRDQLIHLHVVLLGNDVKVRFKRLQAAFIHPVEESALRPSAVVPKGVASLLRNHLNPGTTCWVAGREFVPRLVCDFQGQRAQAIHPLGLEDLKTHGLLSKQLPSPSQRAVELRLACGQSQQLRVVAHDFKHLGVATHQDVLAEGRARSQRRLP